MTILEQIKAVNLTDYGVYPENVAEKLALAKGAAALVVALNNADVDGVALNLLRTDAEKVFAGMALVAEVLNAERKVLYVPDHAPELAATLADSAKENGVELMRGIQMLKKTFRSF